MSRPIGGRRSAARAVVASWLAVVSQGCVSPGSGARAPMTAERARALLAPQGGADAFARLEALAAEEAASPSAPIDAPGLATLLGLGELEETDPSEHARAPLEAAVTSFAGAPGQVAPAAPVADLASPEDRETASYLLGVGEQHARAGEIPEALEALQRAATLDPADAEIALAKSRVMLMAGRRSDAVGAAERALSLGSRDPAAGVLVALESPPGSEHALARLLPAMTERESLDPTLASLAAIAAGEALIERGWLRAGAEAILGGLGSLPEPAADSVWRSDVVRVLGREAELRRESGDALARCGDPGAALAAYRDRGADQADPRELLMLVRTGRPGSAAREIVARVRAERSPPTAGEIAAVRGVSKRPALADVVASALLELRTEFDAGSPTIRGDLARAAAGALAGRRGADVLRAHLAIDAPSAAVARDLLDRAPNIRERVGEAIALTRVRPEHARRWGAALLAGDEPAAEITAALDDADGWDARLLGAGVDLQLQLPRRAIERLSSIADPGAPRGGVDLLLAEAGAEAGRWDVVEGAIEGLRSGPAVDPELLLGALRAAQRLDEAYALAETLVTERDPEVEGLLMASELAILRSEPRDAELFLQTAGELDPFDERVYAAQLVLYGPEGPLADEAQHTRVLRSLREHRAGGALLGLYDARDLAEGGLLDEADRRLRDLALREPDEPGVYELLIRVWDRMAASGAAEGQTVHEDAAASLTERLNARPGSPPIGAALARVLIALGRTQDAIEALENVDERVGSPVLAPMREQVIARELEDPARARAMALARLDHPTLSIGDALGRALLEVEGGDAGAALATLTGNLPASVRLTPEQQQRLARVAALSVASLNPATLRDGVYAAQAGPVVALIDLAADRGAPLVEGVRDARMSLAALDPRATPDQLAALARRVNPEDGPGATKAFQQLAEGLLAARRTRDAVDLCVMGALRGETLDAQLLNDAIRIASQLSEADATRVLLDRLGASGRALEASALAWDGPPPPGVESADVLAELAYEIASLASFFERDDVAEDVYRIALEHDPAHVWSNNDLGYLLADAGRELADAERMILAAYEREPSSPNVVDSLGWVRYKLGVLGDSDGREGAVTLLRRALTLDDGSANATLHDHLGDALWRAARREQDAGRPEEAARLREEAERAWLDAEEVGGNQIRMIRRQGGENPAARRFEARRRFVRTKLLAIQAGEEPPVAPIAEAPPDQ